MTTQGILPSIFIVLIFALLTDAKSIENIRTKRAPNFFAYPRQGRATKEKKALEGEIFWGKRSGNKSHHQNSIEKQGDDESFLHYPRMGRRASWEGIDDLSNAESTMCCTKGVRVAYTMKDSPVMYCKADRCCEGLEERTYFTQLGDDGISMVVDCTGQQDEVSASES